jgi:glycosyltransferase involved in cell wall biosynthesis
VGEPVVSVVVPTHNRATLLPRLVDALRGQEDVGPFEVIVVDDGSHDGTQDVLEALAADDAVRLIAARLPENRGPAAARNKGWRRARAPLVAFVDDDCTPEPRWLAALVEALGNADLAQGKTVPDPEQLAQRNAFSHSVVVEGEWGYYESCNIGYRRDLLERLGGFDEGFRYAVPGRKRAGPIFGEDTDLAWRAKAAGARTAFAANAIVRHDVLRHRYVDHLRQLPRREGVVRALKLNPALRQRCHYRWFWRPAHPPALAAAAGLAALAARPRSARRWLVAAALVAPYVRFRTRVEPTGRTRNRPVVIPLALVSDLVEIGVFARASIRYRTLLL